MRISVRRWRERATEWQRSCGRELSGRAVAVATGRHGPEELADAGADAVFEDFRNTADVVRSLLGYSDRGHIQGSHGGGDLGR